jgi:RHS repeat-associated protein
MRLGNGRFESTQFNSRLQPTQIALGTSANNTSLLKLNYDYGTTDNNGNVKSQTITVPTVGNSQGFVATQTYEYDELNRIKSAVETSNSQTNWQQYFRYDRYGNRTVITEQNRIGQEAFTTASIVGLNPDINIANNRIVPKPNSTEQYQFDASGNMTRDAVGNVYSYDAENHQTQYFESTNTTTPKAKYFYDGDGRRVKKVVKVQSGQQTVDETTLFVYDGGGALVAEYTINAPASTTTPQTIYLTADVLGSPRINTNQKGEVVARHDYLPFGDEIIGLGQRIQHQEYVDDDVRKKFTGYEKDQETGLDFAQARYYGNGLGRFTSVDPALESMYLLFPQSMNRYIYCGNNPIICTDPDGLGWRFETYTNSNGDEYRRPVFDPNVEGIVGGPAYFMVGDPDSENYGKYIVLDPYAQNANGFAIAGNDNEASQRYIGFELDSLGPPPQTNPVGSDDVVSVTNSVRGLNESALWPDTPGILRVDAIQFSVQFLIVGKTFTITRRGQIYATNLDIGTAGSPALDNSNAKFGTKVKQLIRNTLVSKAFNGNWNWTNLVGGSALAVRSVGNSPISKKAEHKIFRGTSTQVIAGFYPIGVTGSLDEDLKPETVGAGFSTSRLAVNVGHSRKIGDVPTGFLLYR